MTQYPENCYRKCAEHNTHSRHSSANISLSRYSYSPLVRESCLYIRAFMCTQTHTYKQQRPDHFVIDMLHFGDLQRKSGIDEIHYRKSECVSSKTREGQAKNSTQLKCLCSRRGDGDHASSLQISWLAAVGVQHDPQCPRSFVAERVCERSTHTHRGAN